MATKLPTRKRRAHSKAAAKSRWKKSAIEMMEDLADPPKSPNSTTTTCTTNPPQHNTIPSHSFGELATTGSVILTEQILPSRAALSLINTWRGMFTNLYWGFTYTLSTTHSDPMEINNAGNSVLESISTVCDCIQSDLIAISTEHHQLKCVESSHRDW